MIDTIDHAGRLVVFTYAMAMEIRFAAHRQHEAARIHASDSAMAILASLRIARAELDDKELDTFLPQAFDGVRDLQRLNLRVRDARRVIDAAEGPLVYMAIPYALAVHHAFGLACLRMIAGESRPPDADEETDTDDGARTSAGNDGGQIKLSQLHTQFEANAGVTLNRDLIELFDLMRAVRNRLTHYGGARGNYLNTRWRNLSDSARAEWVAAAGRAFPTGPPKDRLDLGIGELVGCLMVITRVGREMNDALSRSISRTRWAEIAADDFQAFDEVYVGGQGDRLRRLRGFVAVNYSQLGFSDAELGDALNQTQMPG